MRPGRRTDHATVAAARKPRQFPLRHFLRFFHAAFPCVMALFDAALTGSWSSVFAGRDQRPAHSGQVPDPRSRPATEARISAQRCVQCVVLEDLFSTRSPNIGLYTRLRSADTDGPGILACTGPQPGSPLQGWNSRGPCPGPGMGGTKTQGQDGSSRCPRPGLSTPVNLAPESQLGPLGRDAVVPARRVAEQGLPHPDPSAYRGSRMARVRAISALALISPADSPAISVKLPGSTAHAALVTS